MNFTPGEFQATTPMLTRVSTPALLGGPFAVHPEVIGEEPRVLSVAKCGLRLAKLPTPNEAMVFAQILLDLQPDVKKWDGIRVRIDDDNPFYAAKPKWLEDIRKPAWVKMNEWRKTEAAQ